jgi:hypothetical protein
MIVRQTSNKHFKQDQTAKHHIRNSYLTERQTTKHVIHIQLSKIAVLAIFILLMTLA